MSKRRGRATGRSYPDYGRGKAMSGPVQTEATAEDRAAFLDRLRRIVGPAEVLTADRATRRYTRGFRYGEGAVAAVVRPGSLVQMWRVLNAAIASGRTVILQAAKDKLRFERLTR